MYGCYVEVVSLILLLRYHPIFVSVLYQSDITTCTFKLLLDGNINNYNLLKGFNFS